MPLLRHQQMLIIVVEIDLVRVLRSRIKKIRFINSKIRKLGVRLLSFFLIVLWRAYLHFNNVTTLFAFIHVFIHHVHSFILCSIHHVLKNFLCGRSLRSKRRGDSCCSRLRGRKFNRSTFHFFRHHFRCFLLTFRNSFIVVCFCSSSSEKHSRQRSVR